MVPRSRSVSPPTSPCTTRRRPPRRVSPPAPVRAPTRRSPAWSCQAGWWPPSCAARPPCSTESCPDMTPPALLVLEDGMTLHGTAFGAEGETFGEMVFNTGMTGYQETLTDPSYCRQIVAMTAPHIGNTGVNDEDPESGQVWVSGYVVREPARLPSSWRATRDLDAYLRAEGIPGIAIRGTRLLTRRGREGGAMGAPASAGESSPERLLERVLASPQMTRS